MKNKRVEQVIEREMRISMLMTVIVAICLTAPVWLPFVVGVK